jgi:hypothetical protein
MLSLCPPALIYVVFSMAQIIIDIFKSLYNAAFIKFTIAILITLLLNALCEQGLGVVSWIIVFIPFILMTFITAMLLYIFGMDASIGASKTSEVINDSIYIIKTPSPSSSAKVVTTSSQPVPKYSTSPAYESFTNDSV